MKADNKCSGTILIISFAVLLLLCALIAVMSFQRESVTRAQQHVFEILRNSAAEKAALFKTAFAGQVKTLGLASVQLEDQGWKNTKEAAAFLQPFCAATDFLRLVVAAPDGIGFTTYGKKVNVMDRRYFKEAMSGRVYAEWVPTGRVDPTPKFIIARPLIKKDKVEGVLVASYNEQIFSKLLAQEFYSGLGYSFIGDDRGIILLDGPNAGTLTENRNLLASLKEAQIYGGKTFATVSQEIKSGKTGVISIKLRGEHLYLAYRPIGIKNWIFYNVVPGTVVDKEVTSATASGYRLIFTIAAIALCFVTLVILINYQRIKAMRKEKEESRLNEERFNLVTEGTSISVWEYDIKDKRIKASKRAAEQHGAETVIENALESLIANGIVHPDSVEAARELFRKIESGVKEAEGVFYMRRADGNGWFYENIRYTVIFNEKGEPVRAIGMGRDVTEEKELALAYEKELALQQTMVTDIFAQALYDLETGEQVSFLSHDENERIHSEKLPLEAFNKASAEGVAEDEAVRKKILRQSASELKKAFRNGEYQTTTEYLHRSRVGKSFWVSRSLHLKEEPTTKHIMAFFYLRDIDEQKSRELALQKAVETDSLTGLYNHAGVINRISGYLAAERAEESDKGSTLFVIDIDRFKKINDTRGHQWGDKALETIATKLKSTFRSEDIIGRVGGDEFLVLAKNIKNRDDAATKAHQIVLTLQLELPAEKDTVSISASVGAALHRPGESFEEFYARADSALYAAKESGRKNFSVD